MIGRTLFISLMVSICLPVFLFGPVHARDDECALAQKIAEQAASEFKTNQKDGLKRFLQAHKMCPSDAEISANLGLACYRYGNVKEAETYLKESVAAGCNKWTTFNLLSWVMLETGSDAAKALEYAKKACSLNSNSAAAFDTLTRAFLANMQLADALNNAKKVRDTWPKDQQASLRYAEATDAYMACYLTKTKAGKHDEAIAGLAKIDFDPDIARAYCWALFAAGKTEGALSAASSAKKKFSSDDGLKTTFDEIMDRCIQARYQDFKAGSRETAIMAVDDMRKIYPNHQGLKDAYDNMFKAVLAEADTISVPEPMKIASVGKSAGQSSSLLEDLQGSRSGPSSSEDLLVDVDTNIPKGKGKNPDAIAVIIGNRAYAQYGHGIPDVNYAARDAAYMKEYVINVLGYHEDNIIFEHNVTQGSLSSIFGRRGDCKGKLYNYVKAGKSDVFIYYVGHGAPDPQGKGAFLIPVDGDAEYITANGYALDTLYDNLSQVPARKMTIVIDACFSGNSDGGTLVKNISPAMLKTASPVRKLDNAIIFASADKDQVSHWYTEKRHSLFTYFFLKGLRGDADSDHDNCITVSEMKSYLTEMVSYRAQRISGRTQTPLVAGDGTWELARLK